MDTTTIRPLGRRVVVKRAVSTDTSRGGIHIPEPFREKPNEGVVLAVGPEADGPKVGDHVLFGRWTGAEVVVDGQKVIVMNDTDIVGLFYDHDGGRPAAERADAA